jgi:3-dehydroquinate dehydratase
MNALEQKADAEGWIVLGEKDSPYYGKDSSKMTEYERRVHAEYKAGKVKRLSSQATARLYDIINTEMRKVRRDLIKKFHDSEEAAKYIVLNA